MVVFLVFLFLELDQFRRTILGSYAVLTFLYLRRLDVWSVLVTEACASVLLLVFDRNQFIVRLLLFKYDFETSTLSVHWAVHLVSFFTLINQLEHRLQGLVRSRELFVLFFIGVVEAVLHLIHARAFVVAIRLELCVAVIYQRLLKHLNALGHRFLHSKSHLVVEQRI